jgi:hypothetical protein
VKKKLISGGFVQIIVLAIVIIAALAYFNIDLRTIFQTPLIQKIWNTFVVIWASFIKPMIMYLWGMISTASQTPPPTQ